MKIDEYKKLCDNVQVPDVVLSGYQSVIDRIRAEKGANAGKKAAPERTRHFRSRPATAAAAAVLMCTLLALSGGTCLAVKAYISHREQMRNIPDEEIVDLYENVFQYDSGYMSRSLTAAEERRYTELYDQYCRDMAEPEGEVDVISSGTEYKGTGLAFSVADGVLYIPEDEMTDEEILQMVAFNLLKQYVGYEQYVKAANPLFYKNYLDQMTMQEVDQIYADYHYDDTETGFFSRELSMDERGRKKALKKLYQNCGKFPEHAITLIQNESDYQEGTIAFCIDNCTYCLPDTDMSDEQLLELIDHQIKVEYCRQRIKDEIERGVRSGWPQIEYKKRDRIITLNPDEAADENIVSQPWINAYSGVLNKYYQEVEENVANPERYYANVCFIYLNGDEIPEMLFSHGNTDMDYDDHCNRRTYLYTCKNGEAVLLSPGDDTMDDFYGYDKPFCYVEGKGMVYCDYYYIYGFTTYDAETDRIDNVSDHMSRMDIWDLDTMTRTSSNANIQMLHAVYHYTKEEYDDADFTYEYYSNVSGIVRDATTGEVQKIIGDKVDARTYEASEETLWNGEAATQVSVDDFDKIYRDDDLPEALAKCYKKAFSSKQ